MVYEEIMDYLKEIESLSEYHKFSSHDTMILTILAICEVNKIDYEGYKKYLLNLDKDKPKDI